MAKKVAVKRPKSKATAKKKPAKPKKALATKPKTTAKTKNSAPKKKSPKGRDGGSGYEKEFPCCVVKVTSIWFNHDFTSLDDNAFNIRINSTFPVEVPEWREGHTIARESPAAYALEETKGNTLTIKARFTCIPHNLTNVEVRARLGGHLGQIDPFNVNFLKGVSIEITGGVSSEFVTIKLSNATLHKFGGIRKQDIQWVWEYRCGKGQKWQNMAVTKHRIYAVLREPPKPWSQTNPWSWPWTDVLDHTCDVASLKDDDKKAATAITKHVFSSHGGVYDSYQGAPWYTTYFYGFTLFDLTANLNAIPNTIFVNCYDQASAVTAFTTSVGSPMNYHYQRHFGYLNPVTPVGHGLCNNPFYWNPAYPNRPLLGINDRRSSFANHAYGKMSGKVYDACMKPQGGWFIDMGQAQYDNAAIDESVQFELDRSGRGVAPISEFITVY